MINQSREARLAAGDEWFQKLYLSHSPVYHQINAKRPNTAPENNPSEVLDRFEAHGKDRLEEFGKAIDAISKGT